MLDYYIEKSLYEQRLREAEKARRFSKAKKAKESSSILKNLLSFLARF